jgi:integrase/recombinase XerD
MLELYFVKPATVDRIRASWIGGPIEQYIGWLSERGYAARNVFRRVPILVQFGAFAAERGARRLDELPGHIDGFVAEWLRAHAGESGPDACRKIASAARGPIEQMLRIALPDMPAANHRPHVLQPFIGEAPGFFAYLREERGLREATIDHYSHFLRSFEAYVSRIECPTLGALSAPVLSAFITERAGTFGRSAMIGLSRRDYAILLLLVTYGLRAREVAYLTLDDIDWKRERLHVRERKADHVAVYPLSPLVGDAIVDYLKRGRPHSADRQLFLRHLAPQQPLTHAAVSGRASHYLHKASVSVRRAGSHTLRHACVQRLVDAGFPLKTIGDYVGHRSSASTEIYAKVAVESLRDVALGNGEVLP